MDDSVARCLLPDFEFSAICITVSDLITTASAQSEGKWERAGILSSSHPKVPPMRKIQHQPKGAGRARI